MICTFFILMSLAMPVVAGGIDDEIINDLDFFQSMDLMKEDNLFLHSKVISNNQDDFLDILKEENTSAEKKQ